jgi:rare lipoprotein A (peptidoglycan hydrolase)
MVRVTNQNNGKHVDVRINDRGPFVNGRVIDLSLAAAQKIDMVRAGIVPVKLKVIRQVAESLPPGPLPVYAKQADSSSGGGLPIVDPDKSLYRVRIGRASDLQMAAHRSDPHLIRLD